MYLLNIGLSGLALRSNIQVGYEFLMDEVIGNAPLMKSVRAAVREYGTEVPLTISVLEHNLGRNVYVATSNSTDELAVITEDGNDKEEIKEASDSVKIKEVVEVGHHTDSYGSKSPTTTGRVCKLFPGMGCFGNNIDGIGQDNDDNIYEILFKDGDKEERHQDEYDKNDADACMTTGDIRFRIIKNFQEDPFSVAELLVFNPMTSASAILTRMEISTTKNSIICKPILPRRKLYTMTMTRKEEPKTAAVMTMKETATTTMALMNRQNSN